MTPTSPRRIALVTCTEFPDLYEDDHGLVPTFAGIGITATPAVWSDAQIDWSAYEAIVLRSPWDYYVRPLEFRAWLDARIASGSRLCNSPDILAWNFDKRYLRELQAAGVSLVPTVHLERGEKADIAALARARGWDEVVVKPTLSAGAYRTHRFRVADAGAHQSEVEEILADRGLLLQPFLPEVVRDGELSLLFFDGVFSHAVRKRAKAGDYRVQFRYGGTNESVELDLRLDSKLIGGACACVRAAPSLPTYARVDGVIKDGEFLLMELELLEPLLFLAHHPEAPLRFARAVQRRLGEAS